MPCDTIQLSSVKFNMQATDLKIFEDGLRAIGYQYGKDYQGVPFFSKTLAGGQTITGQFKNGEVKLTFPEGMNEGDITAEIKRAYSTEVVKTQAKKFGWQLKEKAPGKFVVIKRV